MDAQIAKLKEWVDASDNIVFLAVQVFRPRAASRISAQSTACITSNINIRLRRF